MTQMLGAIRKAKLPGLNLRDAEIKDNIMNVPVNDWLLNHTEGECSGDHPVAHVAFGHPWWETDQAWYAELISEKGESMCEGEGMDPKEALRNTVYDWAVTIEYAPRDRTPVVLTKET